MAKNFGWEHFSIGFLKNVLYASQTPQKYRPKFTVDSKEALLPYMNYLCDFPNDQFVRKYRREIESCFADDGNHLLNIAKRLSAVNYGGLSSDNSDELVSQLCSKRMTESLCRAYLRELRLAGKYTEAEAESFFSIPRTIDLSASQYDDVSLFPYQKKAAEALKAHFVDNNQNAGILSLPTGGGKTRTSVVFLLKEMLSHGYQVIWLAHRAMLLDQAAEQFYRFAPIIKAVNPEMNELKMICISGSHSTVHSLSKKSNLIISSVQSLCNNTMFLTNILNDNVAIVCDEAHHALAPSYLRIIKTVIDNGTVLCLGFTGNKIGKDAEPSRCLARRRLRARLHKNRLLPAYTRTEFTDDLHKAYGFWTDYQIIPKANMRKIISNTKKKG